MLCHRRAMFAYTGASSLRLMPHKIHSRTANHHVNLEQGFEINVAAEGEPFVYGKSPMIDLVTDMYNLRNRRGRLHPRAFATNKALEERRSLPLPAQSNSAAFIQMERQPLFDWREPTGCSLPVSNKVNKPKGEPEVLPIFRLGLAYKYAGGTTGHRCW